MEDNKKWADANPLANIVTGALILSLWSLLFGVASPVAIIGALPWIGVAFPVMIVAIVICFKNGDIIDGTVNAILTAVALCQNGIKGIIFLVFTTSGVEMPEALGKGMALIDGGAYVVATVLLICMIFITMKAGHKLMCFFISIATIGFFSLAMTNLGLLNLGLVAAVSLSTFACWLVYSGCAMLIEQVFGKKVLPF